MVFGGWFIQYHTQSKVSEIMYPKCIRILCPSDSIQKIVEILIVFTLSLVKIRCPKLDSLLTVYDRYAIKPEREPTSNSSHGKGAHEVRHYRNCSSRTLCRKDRINLKQWFRDSTTTNLWRMQLNHQIDPLQDPIKCWHISQDTQKLEIIGIWCVDICWYLPNCSSVLKLRGVA